MNILWLSHVIPYPPKTGVLQRSFNLLKETSKLGDVHLLAFHKKNVLPVTYDVDEVKRELGKLCKYVEVVDIPAEGSRLRLYWLMLKCFIGSESISVKFYDSCIMKSKVSEIASRIDIDVAFFDTISLAPYAVYFGEVKKVLNHHNVESDLLRQRSGIEKSFFKKVIYKTEAARLAEYEKKQCPLFDIHFTVSDNDRLLLEALVEGLHIEVVPNGVDTDYFFFDQDHVIEKELIIVSGMNWYPNRDAVLYMCSEIWPALSREFPHISLTVVGSDPPKALVDLSRIDKRISVTGFVEDVRPYLQKAEVYLCPMRDGGGTRLKILDAMSMGKAIVSTSKGCEGIEVSGEQDVLIGDTPGEFIKQIGRLLGNSGLRKEIGKSARILVEEKYSWQKIGKTLEKIYSWDH